MADSSGGIRFSIDEWMGKLFWMDSPQPIEFAWTMARIERCESLIFDMAKQACARGLVAILDLGFTQKGHRDKFRRLADEAGLCATVHFIDVDAETRWQRVEQRNQYRGVSFVMPVDRDMFEFMENMWQPPQAEEWQANDGQHINNG